MFRIFYPILFLVLIVSGCTKMPIAPPALIPFPQEINTEETGMLSLSDGININETENTFDNNIGLLESQLNQMFSISKNESKDGIALFVQQDPSFGPEEYEIIIDQNILIKASSSQGISHASVTLLQLINDQNEIPKVTIRDQPANDFRALMIDCARSYHSIDALQEIVLLCQWYKINYLQLHLTDDQLFTFPSDLFPILKTEQHYTKAELIELNEYAFDHGVVLIPEIDVPGHASNFIKKMPDVFGIGNIEKNRYTISMGKEEVYESLDKLFGEVAEIFTHSPYIHIGGDEAFFEGMEDDPETKAYMFQRGIATVDELFRHFLVRLNEMVKGHGKQTLIWAGFAREGKIKIPRDIIVVLWESQYYDPQLLIDDGFSVINATFKPLYIVNNRKWGHQYIYQHWNKKRWESWATKPDEWTGQEVNDGSAIMGGMMCAWEQRENVEIRRARKRLAAMSERLWNPKKVDVEDFEKRLIKTDERLSRFLRPFVLDIKGLKHDYIIESNFNEHTWFDDEITVAADFYLNNTVHDLHLEYGFEKEGKVSWQPYKTPLKIRQTSTIHFRSVGADGQMIGQLWKERFILNPLTVSYENIEKEWPIKSWEKLRFQDSMYINVQTTKTDLNLFYRIHEGEKWTEYLPYSHPIKINSTNHFNAKAMDANGEQVGATFSETYYEVRIHKSLTTGKPITGSNDHLGTDGRFKAVNGRVSLWEMWGGHVTGDDWLKVDLESVQEVDSFGVFTFWDNYRYYQYTIEGSKDGSNWDLLVDASDNATLSDINGSHHKINPVEVRYLKLNMLYNSANPGLHVVEFSAY